jgi:hypothetical protein
VDDSTLKSVGNTIRCTVIENLVIITQLLLLFFWDEEAPLKKICDKW